MYNKIQINANLFYMTKQRKILVDAETLGMLRYLRQNLPPKGVTAIAKKLDIPSQRVSETFGGYAINPDVAIVAAEVIENSNNDYKKLLKVKVDAIKKRHHEKAS